jgi:LmbE family N-acetylglucosaminyl deacetylase
MRTVGRLVFTAVLLALALLCIGVVAAQPSSASDHDVINHTPGAVYARLDGTLLSPAIFLTPHQDDETLFMGAAIREHVAAGRPVLVVLLTDGGASGVCQQMFGSREDCVAERDREFIAAVTALGATPVIPEDRMADGTLTGAYTAEVIRRLSIQYLHASFKTISEYDSLHADHRAVGRGLYAAYLWGYTDDARWYLRYDDQPTYAGTCTRQYDINSALDLYRPVGWASVPAEFQRAWNSSGHRAAYSKAYAPSQRKKAGTGFNCYPDDKE